MSTTLDRQVLPSVRSSPPLDLQAQASSPALPPLLSAAALAVLLCGAVLPMLDFFIVNVALPTIDSTLQASAPMLELIVAGYGTAYALFLIVGGRLGDRYGRRTVFTVGLAGFTLTSLLCGVAPSIDVLVAARIAQGVSASLIVPQVLATFQATLTGEARGRALGLYGATAGLSSVAGQLVGGVLVTANIAGQSWRPIFLVNVPIGVVAFMLARRLVPNTRSSSPASVDLLGTGFFGLTMVSLLIPLTEGRALGWPLWTWLVLAVSPVAAVATYLVERRAERRGMTPLLPPSLLGLRSMRLGIALGLPFYIGFGAFMFVFSLTVQDGMHADALHSGLAITPLAFTFFVGSLLTPRLIARYGRSVITAGAVIQALALASLVAIVLAEWPNAGLLELAPSLAVAGLGGSLVFGSLFRVVLSDVPAHLAGIGGGVMITLQQSGYALGVATLGTLFIGMQQQAISSGFGLVVGIEAVIGLLLAVGSLRLPAIDAPADVLRCITVIE